MGELRKALHRFGIGSIESVDELRPGQIVKFRQRKSYRTLYDHGGKPLKKPWEVGKVGRVSDINHLTLRKEKNVTVDFKLGDRRHSTSSSIVIHEVNIREKYDQVKAVTPIGKFFLRRAHYSYEPSRK